MNKQEYDAIKAETEAQHQQNLALLKAMREVLRVAWDGLRTPEQRATFLSELAERVGVSPNDLLDWMMSDRFYTWSDLAKKQADQKTASKKGK